MTATKRKPTKKRGIKKVNSGLAQSQAGSSLATHPQQALKQLQAARSVVPSPSAVPPSMPTARTQALNNKDTAGQLEYRLTCLFAFLNDAGIEPEARPTHGSGFLPVLMDTEDSLTSCHKLISLIGSYLGSEV